MIISVIDHGFKYETEKLCRIFFPNEEFVFTDSAADGELDYINTRVACANGRDALVSADISYSGNKRQSQRIVYYGDDAFEKKCERALALCLYDVMKEVTGYTPPWGILTGVRPAKLMSSYRADMDGETAKRIFTDELMVSREKTELAFEVAEKESYIISLSRDNSFSLYVSVPFCPTRCSYCSFVSHSNASAQKLIPQYVELLCREIEITGRIASELGLKAESVYYGGGTPTVLTAQQLERVMDSVSRNFDLSGIREYTVEAGRPDSITPEKLKVIKSGGADRISINPQTFHDDILNLIGRRHTSAETFEAFEQARRAGIGNINMDLIAGLPTDTAEGFAQSLDITASLDPESITVHTLALKRSARLVTDEKKSVDAQNICEMLGGVRKKLYPLGYRPYYMYRQSKTAGNMENVGWAKEGFESFYNVFMMEECHTVLGVGGAAVTKLKKPGMPEIERIFNYKYPYEYIERFDRLMERKGRIHEFYEK